MKNILTTKYEDLNMNERAEANEKARQLGAEEAGYDLASGGAFDDTADERTYWVRVVEPAIATGGDDESDFYESLSEADFRSNDPRVSAFNRAWNKHKEEQFLEKELFYCAPCKSTFALSELGGITKDEMHGVYIAQCPDCEEKMERPESETPFAIPVVTK